MRPPILDEPASNPSYNCPRKGTSWRTGGSYKRGVPTLLQVEGFRFYFFSDERQEPPHVHVRKGDSVAKLWLQRVEFVFARGFSRAELRRIRELTLENQVFFVERWNEYFGHQR